MRQYSAYRFALRDGQKALANRLEPFAVPDLPLPYFLTSVSPYISKSLLSYILTFVRTYGSNSVTCANIVNLKNKKQKTLYRLQVILFVLQIIFTFVRKPFAGGLRSFLPNVKSKMCFRQPKFRLKTPAVTARYLAFVQR